MTVEMSVHFIFTINQSILIANTINLMYVNGLIKSSSNATLNNQIFVTKAGGTTQASLTNTQYFTDKSRVY